MKMAPIIDIDGLGAVLYDHAAVVGLDELVLPYALYNEILRPRTGAVTDLAENYLRRRRKVLAQRLDQRVARCHAEPDAHGVTGGDVHLASHGAGTKEHPIRGIS